MKYNGATNREKDQPLTKTLARVAETFSFEH